MSEKDDVSQKIAADYREFRTAARYWSIAYNASQFGAAALSAAAALVLKLDGLGAVTTRNDWGAILAAAAAVITTVLTTGRFKDKWEANRIAAFAVRDLSYQIAKSTANTDEILTQLQRVGLKRNDAIVGLPTELHQAEHAESGQAASAEGLPSKKPGV